MSHTVLALNTKVTTQHRSQAHQYIQLFTVRMVHCG